MNGASFLKNDADRKLILSIIRTYLEAMQNYLKPGTPESKINCNTFDERKWLDFRAIFVRCYRNYTVEGRNNQRGVVVKYAKALFSSSYMKTTKPIGVLYLVDLTAEETNFLREDGWKPKASNPFHPNSLGVGMHNWWGPKERKTALDSPIKETQQARNQPCPFIIVSNMFKLVNLRSSTREDLYINPKAKRKLEDLYIEEEDMQIQPTPPKRQKIGGNKRPNKRNRAIHGLHEKMKRLIVNIK